MGSTDFPLFSGLYPRQRIIYMDMGGMALAKDRELTAKIVLPGPPAFLRLTMNGE